MLPNWGVAIDFELCPILGISVHFPDGDDKIYVALPFLLITIQPIDYTKEDHHG